MKTSKPISTISYNSIEFLENVLNNLLHNGYIQYYMYIEHKAEKDETKDHIHLYIEPCDRLDTSIISDKLKEYPNGDFNEKPLACMPFRNAKTHDWILYDLHDKRYLQMKLETREYHYSNDDIKSSDEDYKMELIRESYRDEKIWRQDKILELMDMGMSVSELCFKGVIKPSQAFSYQVYEQLYRKGHYLLSDDNPFWDEKVSRETK